MKAFIFVFVLIILSGTSCKRAYLALHGVRKPQVETKEEIQKNLGNYNALYPGINAVPADTGALYYLIQAARGLPSNMVFNRDGWMIEMGDTGYCAGKALKFAQMLGRTEVRTCTNPVHLSEIFSRMVPLGAVIDTAFSKYDYTIVALWTCFMGASNKNVFRIIGELQSRPDLKTNFILINMDVQESWNTEWMPYQF